MVVRHAKDIVWRCITLKMWIPLQAAALSAALSVACPELLLRSHKPGPVYRPCAQVDNGATAASSAAPAAAMAPAVPGEAISLLLKESLIVVLQKDGGVDNMEVQGTIALQVLCSSLPD